MKVYCPTLLTDCTFTGNSAAWDGGAVSVASAIFENCVFTVNRALGDESSSGGTVHIIGGAPYDTAIEFNKCTFNKNWAELGCAISRSGTANVNNCIVWGSEDQIRAYNYNQFPFVDYSDIKGEWTWPGKGDIDAGNPNSPIGHEPFPNGGIINMGAYGGTPQASLLLPNGIGSHRDSLRKTPRLEYEWSELFGPYEHDEAAGFSESAESLALSAKQKQWDYPTFGGNILNNN